jgi:DNA polymerase III delta subunit
VTIALLFVHGDDDFGIGESLAAFAARIDVAERTEIRPERSPDEDALDRAQIESATVGMFGAHLVVLHQPLLAAGRSSAATDKLLGLIAELPEGAALALAELRPSRDAGKPPALLQRIAEAVTGRGGTVEERATPRRNQLQGWIRGHATEIGVAIEPRAAALLAERVGGAIWESDIERGQQTRLADGELRKLATYAAGRSITVDDVEALVTDTRPASLFAITNAIDRREPAAAAVAIERAIGDGQPVLRILAALEGRIADLIVARDLGSSGATPQELTRRVGRGNARMAERIAESARRYSGVELERMLRGLFEADLSIKANEMAEEPALVAWLGEFLLATRPTRG